MLRPVVILSDDVLADGQTLSGRTRLSSAAMHCWQAPRLSIEGPTRSMICQRILPDLRRAFLMCRNFCGLRIIPSIRTPPDAVPSRRA